MHQVDRHLADDGNERADSGNKRAELASVLFAVAYLSRMHKTWLHRVTADGFRQLTGTNVVEKVFASGIV